MKDKVFNKEIIKQFEFDEEVASVFDDMLSRSVPFYDEALNLTTDFAIKNSKDGDIILDLGCSTASTLIEIYRKSKHKLKLVGIDNSPAMLKRANRKIRAYGADIDLLERDILKNSFIKSNVIITNYTLQFIRPLYREELVKKIYNSLRDNGVFIFSEKVVSEDNFLNKQLIDKYFEFKKEQGYSEFEIVQKREALENVLIPYSENENIKLLKRVGFKNSETIFKWVNFATFIARK